ncbi:MAG: hypothetical protein LBJ94_04200 [Puniceicoccales bacterium]|jgi:NDP-sugar pyrophosphorylase family protein|nr:hypothetical protein [Puniceicoccales bacterium]
MREFTKKIVATKNPNFLMGRMNSGITLVTMAAGSSSRYGTTKQLERFGARNLTIAEYNMLDAIEAGFTNFVFVVREQMADIFHRRLSNFIPSGFSFSLAYQRSEKNLCHYCKRLKPWGTGHALLSAKFALRNNFGLVNADDLYGRDAIGKLADFLKTADASSPTFANVGYRMEDTLSENGTVSRGVMNVDGDGNLINIVEHGNVSQQGGKIRSKDGTEISNDALVSMNLWGFTTKIFEILDKQWAVFTANISNPILDEFYLPSAVNTAMQSGECAVKILRTTSKWHGITYSSDKYTLEKFLQNH